MVHSLSLWFLAAAFLGAGIVNAIGAAGARNEFAKWGYPRWWGIVTGGLEIAAAALLALPATRIWGAVLAATIIAAAILTVLRHRDYQHLPPLSVFVSLIAVWAISS
ncbi:DoxX family protein [Rhizobium viscosum]|uniref:Membrane protein YphA (DoxX/SURF4 family) n=1 Tax=Rhizobium viscosum TaxID=1673 RepID=A0ABR9IU93_RHIVS|nr:DoxX family protein [Rhizobium viscosum]MBE1506761.1 putative membrane protein YphA (DoxX/SURF4 family) [Rhizobium viscosum]